MPEINFKLNAGFIAGAWRLDGGQEDVLFHLAQLFQGDLIIDSFVSAANALDKPIEISPEKVRFTGYEAYGFLSCNVPVILVSVHMFYREGVSKEQLDELARMVLSDVEIKFRSFHKIAKIYCGNVNGFAELNKPE